MRRVLFGDFGAVLRAGFDDVLRGEAVEVLGADGHELFERLVDALPDVVVLDLDQHGVLDLVHRIVHQFPTVKVVACSSASAHPMMRIFPPLHYGESYTTELEPALLTSAIQT